MLNWELGSVQYICMNLIFKCLTNVCSLWLQVAAFGEVSSVCLEVKSLSNV
jgi:hypothetical protein